MAAVVRKRAVVREEVQGDDVFFVFFFFWKQNKSKLFAGPIIAALYP
jgi:hypothetical protein